LVNGIKFISFDKFQITIPHLMYVLFICLLVSIIYWNQILFCPKVIALSVLRKQQDWLSQRNLNLKTWFWECSKIWNLFQDWYWEKMIWKQLLWFWWRRSRDQSQEFLLWIIDPRSGFGLGEWNETSVMFQE